jgi:ectoine hydroxylase-related dioxygenase (phytanoyl-CoA dioxygenase family)
MTPEEILGHKPRVLSQEQREFYFEQGYLLVEEFIDKAWLTELREAIQRQVEASRKIAKADAIFDLEPGHSAEEPRLRRVSSPCDQDIVFWRFLTESRLVDLLADVLGPDVKFYQSKLNFKWAKGGTEVKWHQDAPFFPHTNSAVLTCGTYIFDCGMEQGPLGLLPGSHKGPIYDHYNADGNWSGEIQPEDVAKLDLGNVDYLCGSAGSVTLHNYRMVHGSRANHSDLGRPLLLNVMSAADAMPYTANALKSQYEQRIIRGEPAKWSHHEDGRYLIPPDWSGGYTSIFDLQQKAGKSAAE